MAEVFGADAWSRGCGGGMRPVTAFLPGRFLPPTAGRGRWFMIVGHFGRIGLVGYLVGRLGRVAGRASSCAGAAVTRGAAGSCPFMIAKSFRTHTVNYLRAEKWFRDHGHDMRCREVSGWCRRDRRDRRGQGDGSEAVSGLRRSTTLAPRPGNVSQIADEAISPKMTHERSWQYSLPYTPGGIGGRRKPWPFNVCRRSRRVAWCRTCGQ
jgi:hypothetical protein